MRAILRRFGSGGQARDFVGHLRARLGDVADELEVVGFEVWVRDATSGAARVLATEGRRAGIAGSVDDAAEW